MPKPYSLRTLLTTPRPAGTWLGRWPLLCLLGLLLSFRAQAQIEVDGRLSAQELGPGGYHLAASYSGAHSVADRGLKNLYVARTATTVHLMLVASITTQAPDYGSLVLYLNGPERAGTPAGTRLAGGSDLDSPLYHRPVLDLEADYGLRVTTSPAGAPSVYQSVVDYTVAPTAGRNPDVYPGITADNGQVLTMSNGALAGSKMAFFNTPSLSANTSTGWELAIPLAALGLQVGSPLELFGAYTDGEGRFTTDVFPQVTGRTTPFGVDPNFTTVDDLQAIRTMALTLDGQLDPNEIGAGAAGLYQLVGEYPTPHPAGFGDWGLTKLYMASTLTKLHFFVVGTVENNGNAFQLYLNVPGLNGIPRGTALPGAQAGSTTSFAQMKAKLDMETDLGLALEGTVLDYTVSAIRYAGTAAEGRSGAVVSTTGSPITFNAFSNVAQFNGMMMAYRNSPTGRLSSNPGTYGWEVELDRAALGVSASLPNAVVQVFLAQNNPTGNFLSSDVIPAVPGNGITNLGTSSAVDFTQLPGRQALTYALTCPVAASLSYDRAAYCQSDTNPTPRVQGPAGGYFSAPAGLPLDANGTIDLAAATPGTYTITYNADVVNCPTVATTQLTITRPAAVTFSYPAATYCRSTTAAVLPVLADGASRGTFSASPAGLSLDAATGAFVPGSSQPGTYTITSTLGASGGCAAATATTQVIINALPVASITASGATTICQGSSVTLTASGGDTYRWSTGATSASIVVAAGGTYSVTVSSAAGCSATASTSVTVTPLASAAFSYGASTFCQSGPTPTPTVTGTAGGTFSAEAGLRLNPTTGAIDLGASTPGTYTITYTTGTSCPVSATATLTLAPATSAAFQYAALSFCQSASTASLPTVTGTNGGTFSAASGLSLNPTTGAITPAASTPGTYTVTYAVGGPCPSTATAQVTITAPATADFRYPVATSYCAGSSGTVAPVLAAGANGGTFAAAAGLRLNPSTGVIDLSNSTPGTYTVTNTIASSGACGAVVATATITLEAVPTATLAAGGPATFCEGSSVVLTAPAGNGLAYQFQLNGQALAGATSATYTARQSGTYTVTVTNGAGCGSTSPGLVVRVEPTPPTPTLTATPQPGGLVLLTSSAATGNQFYLNGQPISGATSATYLANPATQTGLYTVVATSAVGCASVASAPVSVVVTSAAAASAAASQVQVYPNPSADGRFTVALSEAAAPTRFTVLNGLGAVVFEGPLPTAPGTSHRLLDLSHLPTGLYWLRATTKHGSFTQRLVKE